MGPHGPIELYPPEEAEAGQLLHYRLAPPPEFSVEVQPGMNPGDEALFKRPDGVEISVVVPPGLKPGDTFPVLPPALMVRVPESSQPGDAVIFRSTMGNGRVNGMEVAQWCRARVPKGARPGKYFAVRLPVPDKAMGA